jgi:hypothetical protein
MRELTERECPQYWEEEHRKPSAATLDQAKSFEDALKARPKLKAEPATMKPRRPDEHEQRAAAVRQTVAGILARRKEVRKAMPASALSPAYGYPAGATRESLAHAMAKCVARWRGWPR